MAALAVGGLLAPGPVESKPAPPVPLPPRLPPAAYVAEPVLPVPAGWTHREAFPRTSGTGRLSDGALYWTDFLYDDHGAQGDPTAGQARWATYGSPSGSYLYPEGKAHNNGADIFRLAIGRRPGKTRWRVDWTTLADPNLPIVAFGLDRDNKNATDIGDWPGVGRLRGLGTDSVLIVSSRGAWLDGRRVADTSVDMATRSFVVTLPDAVLPAGGLWTVYAVAGLADASGRAFAPIPPGHGALPLQPPVYNVGFRDHHDEPVGSAWRESTQAAALRDGDITNLGVLVDWPRLERLDRTPEPFIAGPSDRWYVSAQELGQGVNPTGTQIEPKFLGRLQPYSIFIPPKLDLRKPVALTMQLHSYASVHTQYEDKPETQRQLCTDRGSICVTPLQRGPDGYSVAAADLDFWEVLNRVGTTYAIDWERTSLWGYSMGAQGVYRMAATYPHVFARGAVMAGGSGGGGVRPTPGGPDIAAASTETNTTPLLDNLRGIPLYIGQGALDQLNPLPGSLDPPSRLDQLGFRYQFDLFPAEDHLVFALKDGFPASAAYLGTHRRGDQCPRQVTYRWYPRWDRPQLGVRTVGAYWVHDPVALPGPPERLASIEAVSRARQEPTQTVVRADGVASEAQPSPAVRRELTWKAGALTPRQPTIELAVEGVQSLTVDLACAGMLRGEQGTIAVRSTTPVQLTVLTSDGPGTVTVAPGQGAVPFRA